MGEYIVEGVSQETFFTICLTLCIVFPILLLISNYLSRRRVVGGQRIHPTLRANVERIRHRVLQRDGQENRNHQDQCPICIDTLHLTTETNCGHFFCAPCLLAYWHHGSWLHCMRCPVCRQEVTIIFSSFTEDESSTTEATELLGQISTYNRRFSGEPRTIMEYITDFPVLLRHLLEQLFTPSGMMWMFRLRIMLLLGLVFLYILSPLDLLPESVFGLLGLADDLIILLIVLVYLTVMYRAYIAQG